MSDALRTVVALAALAAASFGADDARFPLGARLVVRGTSYDAVVREGALEPRTDVAGRTVDGAMAAMTSADGEAIADLFVFRHDDGGVELLVANGRLSRHVGFVAGRLLVGAGRDVIADVDIALHDGAAHVIRVGDVGWRPMTGFVDWYLRHGPPVASIRGALVALAPPAPDVPKTSQQGSPRNVVGIWPHGAALAALSPSNGTHDRLRGWAHDWIDQQYRRSLHYYYDDGRLFRAAEHPDTIVGEQGIGELYGRRDTHGRPTNGSDNRWTAFDHQHLEAHRALVVFALTGSELARRVAEATLEGALGYPGVDAPKASPFNGNTRALGWTARQLALAIAVFGADRPQYLVGARHVVESFALTLGEVDGWPWLTMPPPRCDHICPEVADYVAFAREKGWDPPRFESRDAARGWLLDKAEADGLGRWTYTSELDERFEMVVVWQTAVAVAGLADLLDVVVDLTVHAEEYAEQVGARDDLAPAPAALRPHDVADLAPWDDPSARDELSAVLDHGLACLLGPGRDGATYFHGDYAPRVKRTKPPASPYHGTSAWIVDALCRAARTSPRHAATCAELARIGYTQSEQAALDEHGLDVYWEALGRFGVRE